MTPNTILESLYHHPANGEDNIFLAAFVSADRTYPIFVNRVTLASDRANPYVAYGTGYKWGYDAPPDPIIRHGWYNDERIALETSERLYTIQQINSYRWHPAERSLSMPAELAARFRLQSLRVFAAHVDQETESPAYATIVALDERHARLLHAAKFPEETLDWLYEIPLDRPLIEYMTP